MNNLKGLLLSVSPSLELSFLFHEVSLLNAAHRSTNDC